MQAAAYTDMQGATATTTTTTTHATRPLPTCSAMYFMPLSGLPYSNVSPRMGLKGFQGRSMVPKGPIVKPTTHASLHAQAGAGGRAVHATAAPKHEHRHF